MPCRVGITTNPAGRKAYWESKVVGLSKWRILKNFWSQQEAQEYETNYANRYDCVSAPGGNPHLDQGLYIALTTHEGVRRTVLMIAGSETV